MKSQLMTRIATPLLSVIDAMRAKFEHLGVLSLHKRDNKRLEQDPKDFFDLGSLAGWAMDPHIASALHDILHWHDKTFSNNTYFVGGKEIVFLHRKYNDSGYKHVVVRGSRSQRAPLIEGIRKANNGYDPSANRLQIAQLEFASQFMTSASRAEKDWPFFACRTLGDLMTAHFGPRNARRVDASNDQ
jgi:hypothetical protein